jgi:hypothetical protein
LIDTAIEAVGQKRLDGTSDLMLAEQLSMAKAELIQTAAPLEHGGDPRDVRWLGQLVSDQWDPHAPEASAVLMATQELQSFRDGGGDRSG